jgi:alpha-mannosidase
MDLICLNKNIMKRIFLIFGFLIISFSLMNARSFITPDDYLINGYSKKNAGLDYDYATCIPGLRESLLLRATSGKEYIEWETETVPSGINKKYAAFIWVAALGSSPGLARMDMNIDGNVDFSFYTDGRPDWEVSGADGSTLSFHSIMVDQNGDNHGYMVLRTAVNKLTAGKPLKIKVTGSKSNLTSWYMTFKKEVRTGVTLNPFPAILLC